MDENPNIPATGQELDSKPIDVVTTGGFEKATLCFSTNSSKTKGACLAYYDLHKNRWVCEDKCVEKNSAGLICGDTDHFTSFAILLGAVSEGECSDNSFITGSATGDLILVASCVALICVLCVLLVVFASTGHGRKYFLGKEGYRVYSLRTWASEQVLEYS